DPGSSRGGRAGRAPLRPGPHAEARRAGDQPRELRGVQHPLRGRSPDRGPDRRPQGIRALTLTVTMDELYRDQILEHYKRPHHFGRLNEYDLEFEDSNPFCGDEQHVFLKLDDDGKVSEVSFEGQGCAISTAATSLLSDELEGMTREEILALPRD